MKRILILTASIILLTASAAMAQQLVFDGQSAAKLTEQINAMKEQIDEMKAATGLLNDQLESSGAGGTIPLFTLDPASLKRDITRGMQCLLPDLEGLMPNVEFDTIDIGDICQRSDVYKQTLSADPETLKGLSPDQRQAVRADVRERREALLEDSVNKGLAAGDKGIAESQQLNVAADALSQEADEAKNMNERLAVIAKGQIIQIRAGAQTNQLLAQLLKQQSSWYATTGLPVDRVRDIGGSN